MKRLLCLLCLVLPWLAAHAAPTRVVALSWDGAEQLLALGITPLAVAERADYRRWVARPPLPPGVLDAGSRAEPNLERLAELKPDLILTDAALAGLRPRLERIAPTRVLLAFSSQHDNAATARALYLQLAREFGREADAHRRLQALDQRLAQLRRQLRQRYPQGAPAVCVIRVGSPTVVWLYGNNSMPQAALAALGLQPGCPVETGAWGVAQRRVVDLAQLGDTHVLAIAPLDPGGPLWQSPLWRAMPFVRAGRFATMRSTWTYGGVFSLQYLAEAIADGLAHFDNAPKVHLHID
ncbi:iron-siderophore ABC transporter substrate-binding protein [Paludibacterium purpuratum]|uniref:Iron complex transport system substrate-binding protein n=1 Tax=Paludibacterium purpuratum TaxID=1144873 RepID=A0A4R7BFM0_9NEIS|nr:iron-siderophore ABC transporter substrate-binding protein [Paludibacterium purpuratum]TDR82855.1 iron complex transport system substrate-binding protein [Paludibacterium purpuratum]